jgi:hypothetical protein
VLPP